MRYVILVLLLGALGFGVSLVVFGVTTPVAPEASAQLGDTPSLLRHGWSAARDFLQDLVDGFTAPLRGRTERIGGPGSLPQ